MLSRISPLAASEITRPTAESTRAGRDLQSGLGLRLEDRPVASLIPYVRNARTHSEEQLALIAGSIREFGFTNPVLVDGENGVIAGHGRLLAARKLGLDRVPVIELAHLTQAQKRAYILADNRLAERAGWDRDLLALEVGELSELGVDLASLGFETGRDRCPPARLRTRPAGGGHSGASRRSRVPTRGFVAARSAPGALRRCHRPRCGGAPAERRRGAAYGRRSSLRRRL